MTPLDKTFAALADPTRRAVVDLLRKKARRAGDLADSLAITAPALSRHLKVLREGGLVDEEREGEDARIRVYSLRQGPFRALGKWLEEVEQFWGGELAAFAEHVDRTRGAPRKKR
jgi:DNA-binding transcriptional ArsR family regulator